MFNPKQYRDKATEYSERCRTASGPKEAREFAQLEKSFTTLADNEQWLSDNHQKMVQRDSVDRPAEQNSFAQEEHVLRCLGAALIMQWGTLPAKLQRELFDSASSMGELLDTANLREQIARFLHKHEGGKTDSLDIVRD